MLGRPHPALPKNKKRSKIRPDTLCALKPDKLCALYTRQGSALVNFRQPARLARFVLAMDQSYRKCWLEWLAVKTETKLPYRGSLISRIEVRAVCVGFI